MANSPAIRSMESLTARIPAAEIDADGTHDPLGVPSRGGSPVRPPTGIPAEPNLVTTMQASGPTVSRR